MKKRILAVVLLCAIAGTNLIAQSSQVVRAYIDQFKQVAMEEMLRTGVPAAITLAQGIHETGAGTSDLVIKSNNHFGIKCKTEWNGPAVYHDDDARGECFRKYNDPFESYKDHSDFLKLRPYYASLFKLDPMDYKAWAYGLKKAGYATNPRYPQILIKLIEDYNLQDYTLMAMNGTIPKPNNAIFASQSVSNESAQQAKAVKDLRNSYPSGIFRINETKVMLVTAGTSYLKIANENNVGLKRLFDFNDMNEEEVASIDRLIYLQRKRKHGATAIHVVAEGETMYDIAQSEGVRLEDLLYNNLLQPGMEPKAGEKIYLQDKANFMPQLVMEEKEKPVVAMNAVVKTEVKPLVEEGFIVHVVQAKETAYAISKKYSISIDELKEWNGLGSLDLRIGQELRIKKTN